MVLSESESIYEHTRYMYRCLKTSIICLGKYLEKNVTLIILFIMKQTYRRYDKPRDNEHCRAPQANNVYSKWLTGIILQILFVCIFVSTFNLLKIVFGLVRLVI